MIDTPARRHHPNWPLRSGLVLLGCILLLAWLGPSLAPHDPVKPTYIIQDASTGRFVKPPFSAFTVPAFPLGTDALGRDTLSQLLWAIRPTLILVLVVGAARLLLGLGIGLLAGWSTRWPGRLAEALTGVAIAVPVLFVALCVIAALGAGLGVWAFIIGLALNGWAESARLIAGQARLIRGQPYIESARAMGASGAAMLGKHVLPHVMPLAWILLAFEISNTVMTTAGLGFLGYFVYSIWVPDGDWSAVRGSGRPELGQMLASGAAITLRQPWLIVVAGLAILLIVLSFNLLGEGLRREIGVGQAHTAGGRVGQALRRSGAWIGDEGLVWAAKVRRRVPAWAGIGGILVLMLGSGFALWRAANPPMPVTSITAPGGHLWAAQGRDSQRTFWSPSPGPKRGHLLWTLDLGTPLAGGPVVAADHTLYVSASKGLLIALSADGREQWRTALPEPAVFSPALTPLGDIYILGAEGSLSAVSSAGVRLWTATPTLPGPPLSTLAVAQNGAAYYATEKGLVAVEPSGRILWEARLPTYSYITASVKLSPDDRWLLFEDTLVDFGTGALAHDATVEAMDGYLVGTDGQIYQGLQGEVRQVAVGAGALQATSYVQWDLVSSGLGFRVPAYAGIAPDGRVWVLYASYYEYGRLAWLDRSGQVLSMNDLPDRLGTVALIGFDRDSDAFICGVLQRSRQSNAVQCRALAPGRAQPAWMLEVAAQGAPIGGALAADRLYVATADGIVVAIGSTAKE